jgi:hypothetical protein
MSPLNHPCPTGGGVNLPALYHVRFRAYRYVGVEVMSFLSLVIIT